MVARPAGSAMRSKTASSARPKSSGSTRLAITAAKSMSVSDPSRSTSSSVSFTGISSGVATITTPVVAGSFSNSIIHWVCCRTTPTLTSSAMATGAKLVPA